MLSIQQQIGHLAYGDGKRTHARTHLHPRFLYTREWMCHVNGCIKDNMHKAKYIHFCVFDTSILCRKYVKLIHPNGFSVCVDILYFFFVSLSLSFSPRFFFASLLCTYTNSFHTSHDELDEFNRAANHFIIIKVDDTRPSSLYIVLPMETVGYVCFLLSFRRFYIHIL